MGDFAIALKALVEAGANTGYLAVVKRAVDVAYLLHNLRLLVLKKVEEWCTGP